ncbi:MAG: PIN domain-containing protein [Lachnospiraceae bacterium]|nr:PIN domain-containing protein [Lachnospiraceae bacterium]
MKLLLDTHIILWALDDNSKLSEQAKALITAAQNSVYYSSASVWETTIKCFRLQTGI